MGTPAEQDKMFSEVFNPYRKQQDRKRQQEAQKKSSQSDASSFRNKSETSSKFHPEVAFRKVFNPYRKVQERKRNVDPLKDDDMDESLLVAALEQTEQKLGITPTPDNFDDDALDDESLLQALSTAEATAKLGNGRKEYVTEAAPLASPPRKRPANPYLSKSPAKKKAAVVTPTKDNPSMDRTEAANPYILAEGRNDEFDDACLDDEMLMQALEQAESSLQQKAPPRTDISKPHRVAPCHQVSQED